MDSQSFPGAGASFTASSCSLAVGPGLSTRAFDGACGSQLHVNISRSCRDKSRRQATMASRPGVVCTTTHIISVCGCVNNALQSFVGSGPDAALGKWLLEAEKQILKKPISVGEIGSRIRVCGTADRSGDGY